MAEAVIDLVLGDLGRVVAEFYNRYHLAINVIVLTYGTLLMWAHTRLRRVTREMEALILDLAKNSGSPLELEMLYKAFRMQWKALGGAEKIFLPTRSDLWFSRVKRADLVEKLNIQKEFLYVVLAKAGLLEAPGALSGQTYRVWELYRHQLLTGMRARHLEPDVQLKLRRK